MNWVRRIMLAVGLLLIVAIAAAYLLPRHVRVERSATIAATQATLFTVLNSFTHFNKWSPWFELDPAAKYTYEGPGAGVGAKLSWVGNPQTLGSGSQVITASEPYDDGRRQTSTSDRAAAPPSRSTPSARTGPAHRCPGAWTSTWA